MKVVNMGDAYTKRLTLRLTDLQYRHLIRMASELETSPSDYIRYLVTQSALMYDKDFILKGIEGGTSNENVETCGHDSV